MIRVQISTTDITIDGHAGYAEHGKDIICSAVSILTWNLIESIKVLTKDSIEYEIIPGHVHINLKDLSEHGRVLIDSFFIGIKGIKDIYGDQYLQIS